MLKIFNKAVFIMLFIFLFSLNLFSQNAIIKNPSFEEIQNNAAVSWETMVWNNDVKLTEFKVETGNAHSGKYFVSLNNKQPNDARYKQKIDVEEKTNYKISCWIKTENIGEGNKGANISIEGKIESSRDIRGTNNKWELVELYLTTGKEITSLTVTLGLGGYGSTNSGKASFDDIAIEKVEKIPEGISSIKIEKDKPKENKTVNNPGTKNNHWVFLILIGLVLVVIVVVVIFLTSKKKK